MKHNLTGRTKTGWTATFLLVGAAVLAAAVSLSGCGSPKSNLKTLRLNEVAHSIFYAPQYVAMELGYFEDEGINLEVTTGFGADKSATAVLAGLGASAAVLMLIFKDSILGLVAGVQLSANDMLRPGDWITMDKYGANGFVLEVSLTTVKVQNFDKTITTIPPYLLVSDSFQNWRGMKESGGRRMKLSVNVDANTVHFCSADEISGFAAKGYVPAERYAHAGFPIANTQVFRDFMMDFLQRHPDVNHDMMVMVRMLQPTPEGLPVELYCFSSFTDWMPFERFQSSVLDYALVMAAEFGLRVFQRPSGRDFKG